MLTYACLLRKRNGKNNRPAGWGGVAELIDWFFGVRKVKHACSCSFATPNCMWLVVADVGFLACVCENPHCPLRLPVASIAQEAAYLCSYTYLFAVCATTHCM